MTKCLKWILYSLASGTFAGASSALFLYLLKWATDYRGNHLQIIWLLPFAGLLIGWVYKKYGNSVVAGNNLIIDEVHSPKKIIPFRMAPFILLGTVITHLFGGSAGREGTAVQMGASLADQISKFFKLTNDERKIILTTGAGAGFGAAIGAPLAGVIFGMEVLYVGKMRIFALWQNIIASFTAYYVCIILNAPHTFYPQFSIPEYNLKNIFYVILAAISFGLAARGFVWLSHKIQELFSKSISYSPMRPFLGGALLIAIYYYEGSYNYAGLGLPIIQNALTEVSNFQLPAYKAFFTALTVGSGFKGGEFIPLVFVGTTLGSALALVLPVSFKLLASLGFGSVFGAAANTPIACSIMVAELFGWKIWPYALISCYIAYFFSGDRGIYTSQRIHKKKFINIKLEKLIYSRQMCDET